ncbi:MAG: sulfatase-like hydrolase/transferase [Phycisphaeraceae bacterium]
MDRPNILLIMSDEHDPAVTGCYGDRLVHTPHLDGLAAEGVTFDACCTNSPLCVPARLSFTAGQYISRVSAWNNGCRLPAPEYPSLPRVLAAAGYDPVLIGKQHYTAGWDYGFRVVGPQNHIDRVPKSDGRGGRRAPDDQNVHEKSWAARSAQFQVGDHSEVLDHDRVVTGHSADFLRRRRRQEGPFFLFAGYIAPHFPLTVPEAFAAPYRGQAPRADVTQAKLATLPLNYQHLRRGFGNVHADRQVEQIGRDLYWGLTHWFDDQVGQVLDALKQSDVADNTIVIYTADHGENKGDHGLWWKNCMYEHAARVPLIVHWPKRWSGGQRRGGACSLVDVVQTVADLAGGRTPEDWDGDSLTPLLDRADHAWKDLAVSEYYGHNIASGFAMLRQGAWKYVYHTTMGPGFGPQRELYDLTADAGEWTNLAAAPQQAGRVAQMHQSLVNELGADPEETELRCRHELARGYED